MTHEYRSVSYYRNGATKKVVMDSRPLQQSACSQSELEEVTSSASIHEEKSAMILRRIEGKLDRLLAIVEHEENKMAVDRTRMNQAMADLKDQFSQLNEKVTNTVGLDNSVVTTLQGLAAIQKQQADQIQAQADQIAALKADDVTQDELDNLASSISDSANAARSFGTSLDTAAAPLAAAINANPSGTVTPPANPPPDNSNNNPPVDTTPPADNNPTPPVDTGNPPADTPPASTDPMAARRRK
jgi:hypothetical protein